MYDAQHQWGYPVVSYYGKSGLIPCASGKYPVIGRSFVETPRRKREIETIDTIEYDTDYNVIKVCYITK